MCVYCILIDCASSFKCEFRFQCLMLVEVFRMMHNIQHLIHIHNVYGYIIVSRLWQKSI